MPKYKVGDTLYIETPESVEILKILAVEVAENYYSFSSSRDAFSFTYSEIIEVLDVPGEKSSRIRIIRHANETERLLYV